MAWRGIALLLSLAALACSYAISHRVGSVAAPAGGERPRPAPAVDPAVLVDRVRRMKVLDAGARIFLFEKFLSAEEADHIRELAEPRLARSTVLNDAFNSTLSSYRTSRGMFLERGEDEVISRIEERIATWTLLPVSHGEGLQVLRYEKSEHYGAHFDYFEHAEGTKNGGNRFATVLMYLADVEEGGETVFPNIPAPGGENPGFSDCARHHLAAKPRKGDAILFHSIAPSGALERRSLHTACPVIRGVKWSAAKWIHIGEFKMDNVTKPLRRDAQTGAYVCEDRKVLCGAWAEAGECERNPKYMVGEGEEPGYCIAACNACERFHAVREEAAGGGAVAAGAANKQGKPQAQ